MTLMLRSPVACIVHMLIASALSAESLWARLALRPVVFVVTVLFEVIFVVELSITRLAFVCDEPHLVCV
jgi:hypothetical protein